MITSLSSLSKSAATDTLAWEARTRGIESIRRLCEEAIDHDEGWQSFRNLVEYQLKTEQVFIDIAKKDQR